MRAIFRATAMLGGASVINILLGLVSAKVTALLLGPAGFGLMSLLQAVANVGIMLAGLGVSVGLVRAGARAAGEGEAQYESALRRAAWLITIFGGSVAALLILLFREPISELVLARRGGGGWVALTGPALLFMLLAGVQNSVLNARHRVADLARISIISGAVSLVPTVALVWLLREEGVAPALVASAAVAWLVSLFYYRRARLETRFPAYSVPRHALFQAGGDLLRFGIPYTGSMIVGAGVLMMLPVMVLHVLGPNEVGLYRAASALAVNYMGVLLAAMAQDYLPRVSASAEDPAVLNRLINDQLRLVLLVGGPAILAMLGAVPYLLPLLYSHRFDHAADLLEWQLVGDLFKFAAWTMSFVVMARLGATAFLISELAAGAVLVAASWFGMQAWGLPGLGIAFLVTAFCSCLICWALLRARMRLAFTRDNVGLFLALAAAMALLRGLPLLGLEQGRSAIAISLAALTGAYSLRVIVREFGGWKKLLRRSGPGEDEATA
jgi:PST family polysaccharide transporter